MATKKAVDDLSDILGDTPPSTKKGATAMGTKAASAAAAAASAAKHAAKPKVTTKGKMAAVGAGAARIMQKSEAAAGKAKAPAPLPKKAVKAAAGKPAKKAAAASGERSARGAGKFYFSPEDRAKVTKLLTTKVRKPTTTKEFAAANDIPTWQVRLAAVDLVAAKKMTLKKDGAALTMSPK